jgi:molybdate transport system substrate-binding protein
MRRLLAALLVLTAACGTADRAAEPTVLAAASLTEAFTGLGGATFSFAGSQTLVAQIQQGAPADVFAAADETTMQRLVDDGLVEEPRLFARNTLTIAVQPGNPKHIGGLADLADPDVVVVLADPSVPVGRYSAQALAKAGVTVRPRSLELDVRAALGKVVVREADATIVYVTDVRAVGTRADRVAIPAAHNVVARYPIAVVAATEHPEAAEQFVESVLAPAGQRALRRHGFLPAP